MLNLVKDRLRRIRANQRFRELEKAWRSLQRDLGANALAVGKPKRFVVMPSDPWTLVGAKGDEAMIQSVVMQLKAVSPDLEVGILTATPVATDAARALGYLALEVWDGGIAAMSQAVRDFNADSMAVLGADCMDGYYNPMTTLTMLAVADLAARSGVRVSLLGFSFNDKPDQRLKAVFDGLSERVAINVRDDISFERFQSFSRARAQLVADSAFKLLPTLESAVVHNLAQWVRQQHAHGRNVIGFNAHPMLLGEPGEAELKQLIDQIAQSLEQFMASHDAGVAFISHDYRGAIGDDVCLAPLFSRLSTKFPGRLYYDETRCSAAELKAVAGTVDGVVTGRMHLAIAALGMGVPIAALTYQDKFQGLMRHFELPQALLLAPEKLRSPDILAKLLGTFYVEMATHREQVANKLAGVKRLSESNVRTLIAGAS